MSRDGIRRAVFSTTILVGALVLAWLLLFRASKKKSAASFESNFSALLPAGYRPATGSPSAARLNSADGTPQQDLAVLHDLLRQFTTTFPPGLLPPLGDNEDITAALTGRNRRHLSFLPPGYPLIDARGRLLDRWGTPYFFHARSADTFDLRSAGPDRQLFTKDDLVRP
jgi:hypothetical protein